MSEQTTEQAPAAVEERWAFGGRRLLSDGTIGYAWIDDEGRGEEHLFNRNTKSLIGYLYTRQVVRVDKNSISVLGAPQLVGSSWSGAEHVEGLRPVWQAKDAAAGQHLASKRLHNAAAKQAGDLDTIMAPLLDTARQLRTREERDAMTAYVLRRMNEVWFMR